MRHSSSHLYEPASLDEPSASAHPAVPLVFDRAGVRAVDREAIQRFGIPGIVLMENAARGVVEAALEMLAGASPGPVAIICGGGNNGGDGYAIARHLHNRGHEVLIVPLAPPESGSDAAINLSICRAMRLRELRIDQLDDLLHGQHVSLIIDAIFGTGLDRPISGAVARVIETINGSKRPVLAVDIPSGLDCDTGEVLGCCAHATRTVTFVGLKKGFIGLDAQSVLGEVSVADIGAPLELLERYGRHLELRHPEAPEHAVVTHRAG